MTAQTAPQTTPASPASPASPADRHATSAAPAPRRVLVARFVRHYVEMVVAMIAGMVLLGPVIGLVAGAAGLDYSHVTHPRLGAVEMALTMSAGMAFWMRYRRHHWRHVADMTAAMVAPLVVLLPLSWAGLVDAAALPMLEHAAMFPLMLVAMLRTPAAYTGR
jgi:flagellar biosynthetic protein FliP